MLYTQDFVPLGITTSIITTLTESEAHTATVVGVVVVQVAVVVDIPEVRGVVSVRHKRNLDYHPLLHILFI